MNRILRGHTTNFIASFLLAIISLYYINSTMFSHTHVIEGATIVHSHFYCGNHADGQNNDGENDDEQSDDSAHTESELTLIQHLNNIILLKSEFIYTAEITPADEVSQYVPSSTNFISQDVTNLSSPRAPPHATFTRI